MSQVRHPLPLATCVAIEYPGYVRDEEKALATLGGEAAVNAAVTSNWALRLSFRPSDPTTHPLYGEKASCCRLLLRISRRRPQASDSAQSNGNGSQDHTTSAAPMDIDATSSSASGHTSTSDTPQSATDDVVHAVVVARIATVFTFPGLADFQFLPFDPALESRGHDALPFEHLPDKAEPTRTRQPYLMSPPTFSIKDTPYEYDFQPGQEQAAAITGPQPIRRIMPATAASALGSMASAAFEARKLANAASAGAGTNKNQIQSTVFACTTVPQPSRARPSPVDGSGGEPDVSMQTDGEVLAQHVDQILSGRPIWSPALLLETVNARLTAAAANKALQPGVLAAERARRCTVAQLEAVVRTRCYQFTSGPWFKTYVLLGHDPRKEPSSRRLQTISYTLPSDWFLHIKPPTSSSEPNQQLEKAIALEATAKGLTESENIDSLHKTGNRAQPVPNKMTDILRFKALPTSRSTWLQLADLQDDKIQHLMSRTDATKRCNESHGWLTVSITEQLKKLVAERFETLMAEQPAEHEIDQQEDGAAELEPLDMDASSYQDTLQKLSRADLSAGAFSSSALGIPNDEQAGGGQEEAGDVGGVEAEGDVEGAGMEEQQAGAVQDGVGSAAAEEEEEELEWDGGSGEGDVEYDDGGDADDDAEFFM